MICTCAKTMYRNNTDGTRDTKLQGDLRCPKCRGKGRCVKCPDCGGAGIPEVRKSIQDQVCGRCNGSGFIPARRPPQ